MFFRKIFLIIFFKNSVLGLFVKSRNDVKSSCFLHLLCHIQGCNLWRNRVKLLSFSEQLIQPYLVEMHRTGTGLLEVRDFLRVKLDDLWLPVQKSSTSVRQRSGRCWHPARAATGCEQNGGNLNQLRHKLQPWSYLLFLKMST